MSIEDTLPASALSGEIKPTDTIRPPTEETLAVFSSSLRREQAKSSTDFEKLRTLGEGGMGRVELARQRSLPREVALKSVKPSRRNEQTEGALLAEAFCTGALEHPNIVPVHAIQRDEEGNPIIVMKKVDGVSWRERLREVPRPLEDLALSQHLEILMQVCNAAHFAHSKGIIHRDIKPENVMVGSFGEVYLVDWGIALTLSEKEQAKGFAGTPAYMAPEMLYGGAGLSERTDIFLLGASLYELLSGHPPSQGEGIKAVLLEVSRASPPSPPGPEEIVEICMRAMSKEPSARYESVKQLREALSLFLQHQGSRKLTREAQKLLAELPQEQEPLALRKIYIEGHFSLQQALKEWPANSHARETLDLFIGGWIELELQENNLGTAEVLLPNLHAPRPELHVKLEALKSKQREEENAKEKLAAIERDRDISVSRRVVTVFAVIGLITALSGMLYVILRPNGEAVPDDTSQLFNSTITIFLLVMSIVFWKRKTLFQNEISRQSVMAFIGVATCFMLHRALNLLLDRPLEQALTEEIMLIASFCAIMGAYLLTWFYLISAILLVATFVSALYPASAPVLISLSSGLPFIGLLAAWRQKPKRPNGPRT